MTPAKLLVALSFAAIIVLSALDARAQPGRTPPGTVPPRPPPTAPPGGGYGQPAYAPGNYYPPPAPSAAARHRHGWNIGFSLGVGSMTGSDGPFGCIGCDTDPLALSFDLHVGTMLTPNLAIVGEVWVATQKLDFDGNSSINQAMFLLAAQYWLIPRLWLKAGLGIASLSVTYDDQVGRNNEPIDEGSAFMIAAGYELMRSRRFALDLQLMTGVGSYSEIDEDVATTVIALGVNWY